MQIQQGDVTLEKISKLPSGAKFKDKTHRGYVLAEGEVTGHAHCIEDTEKAEFYEVAGVLFVKANKPVSLTHEEHNTITLPEGIWKIGQVYEYDHFLDMERVVRD